MAKKLSNDENIKNLKKRKILRIAIIVFCILTIAFSVLTLVIKTSVIIPIVTFIVAKILIKIRDNTEINKKDDLKDVRKVLSKSKKR